MLNDEICRLRDKLNNSIESNANYDEIYKISVELDNFIAKYYKKVKEWAIYNLILICYNILDGALF